MRGWDLLTLSFVRFTPIARLAELIGEASQTIDYLTYAMDLPSRSINRYSNRPPYTHF